jgi:hypothetical protein
MAGMTKAIRIDIGGSAQPPVANGPFSQAEFELARAIAELHPLASVPDDPRLILEALPLPREAKERLRLGLHVDPRAIASLVENDPVAVWSLSRLDQTQVDLVFAIVGFAIELWNILERN